MLTALLAMSPVRRLAVSLIGAGVLMALGAAGATFVEHRAPWGLEAKRAKLALQIDEPVKGYRARLHWMTADRDEWHRATDRCEAKRKSENTEAANAVSTASDDRARANGSAFNQGYAAGRAVGLQQCGASDANPNPVPGAAPSPDGLRHDGTDLAASFGSGAYRPGGTLPPRH